MEKIIDEVSINEIDISSMNFFVFEGDRIISMYEEFNSWLLDLPSGQRLMAYPKSETPMLPREWYWSATCPDYIKVTGVNTFDREAADINKHIALRVDSVIKGGSAVDILFTFEHSEYTKISAASNLTPSDINYGINRVSAGVETSMSGQGRLDFRSHPIGDNSYIPITFTNGTASVSVEVFNTPDSQYPMFAKIGGINVTIAAARTMMGVSFDDYNRSELIGHVEINGNTYSFKKIANNPDVVRQTIARRNFTDIRDGKLAEVDWMVIRHITQKAAGVETSMSEEEFKSLSEYMQALRDLPESVTDYTDVKWPER